jgi:hypothetical protein
MELTGAIWSACQLQALTARQQLILAVRPHLRLSPWRSRECGNLIMGWGKIIVLACRCGFETSRAQVGHLLAHESFSDGFTVIEATYDSANRRIVEHTITLLANLEDRLNREPAQQAEDAVNTWFDEQRGIIRRRHGHILQAPEDKETTAFQCPECRVSNLVLATVGNWIA